MQTNNNHFNIDSKFIKLTNKEFPNRLNIESLIDDIEGFRLIVKAEFCKDAVRYAVLFDYVEQYVVTPAFPYKSLENFDSPNWGIYKNKYNDSSLLKRYHEETCNMYSGWPINHYVIIGVNDGTGCVEVLSQSDPIVTMLPEKERIILTIEK